MLSESVDKIGCYFDGCIDFAFFGPEIKIFEQENHEFLSSSIQADLGFKEGKPVAACIIYKCLLHWRAFESERTAIFDHIIEGINEVLKVIHSFHTQNSFIRLLTLALQLIFPLLTLDSAA